jgi:hypothetical protein
MKILKVDEKIKVNETSLKSMKIVQKSMKIFKNYEKYWLKY